MERLSWIWPGRRLLQDYRLLRSSGGWPLCLWECDGVLFHPYFYGERAPFKNASARGGFYGLSAQHTPMHLLRAVYEGLALSLYDCYQSLPQVEKDIYIAGGGAASDFCVRWRQIAWAALWCVRQPQSWG
jgi:sugar (pentulose or hexulose) kinase